jgi:hypothetical protein
MIHFFDGADEKELEEDPIDPEELEDEEELDENVD